MVRQQVQDVVVAALATVLKCEIDLDTSRSNNPKWDSLKHIEIIFAVEDELDLEFSEEELASLNSVRQIVDLAMSRHAA